MQLTPVKKVVTTGAIALGVVLGAAGITAAATSSGSNASPSSTPSDQQSTGNHDNNVDFTPANEQGKPEPADSHEAADAPEAATTSPNAQG